jgi:hypothetical protein
LDIGTGIAELGVITLSAMKKSFINYLPTSAAVLLLILFLYTAVSKLLDYRSFYATMNVMPLIKGNAFLLAPAIIVSEIFISCILISPALRFLGLYFSLVLLSAFTFYLLFAVTNGYSLPCSCGGVLRQLSWKQHVVFNIAFILLASLAILSYREQKHLLQ